MTKFVNVERFSLSAFMLFYFSLFFCASLAMADPNILKNPPAGSNIWSNDGNGYSSTQNGQTYSVGPAMPSMLGLNGYQGNSYAQAPDGSYYVQLKSGGWVNAQQYTPALDNPPPPPPQSQNSGGSGSSEPIAETLCLISKALQGPIGKTIATIAIVVLGVGLFLGKVSWPLAVATAIGIGLIFGSSEMVSWLSDQSGSGC